MANTEKAWTEDELRHAVRRWENHLIEQGRTERTIRTYVRDANAFIDDLTSKGRPRVNSVRPRAMTAAARPFVPVRFSGGSPLIPVPPALRRSFDRWAKEGRPVQRPISWPRKRWQAALTEHADFFDELPDKIDRGIVRGFTEHAAERPSDAVRALLAVMAWGAGRTGFWPWRTAEMLACRPDAHECLQAVAATLHADGPLAGYKRLGGDCRLTWLGTSFGTKYLALCQRENVDVTALIHDDVMRGWLLAIDRPDLAISRYAGSVYEAYLVQMKAWAEDLGTDPETVEWVIFRDEQRKKPSSQWNTVD